MNTKTADLSPEEITRKVKKIVIAALYAKGNIKDIDEAVPLTSLGLDSLNVVDIFIGLEREFGIELDEADLDMSVVESVKSLVAYVTSLAK
jgi:acyl carrier protein